MRPNRLILLSQKRIGVKLVCMHRSPIIILHALLGHWMMCAYWNLGQYVVLLDRDEYVVRRDLGGGSGSEGVTEVAEDAFAGGSP
jgi:hypothetical protein